MPPVVTCAECVDRLTDYQAGRLGEPDRAVIDEHLSDCPDCRRFAAQLMATDGLLKHSPRPAPSSDDRLPRDAGIQTSLSALRQLAESLDSKRADDLVQDVVTEAWAAGEDLDLKSLARTLTDRALADHAPLERGIDDFATGDLSERYDADADTPELFYPEFYVDGPDLGRFVDAPNQWGANHVHLGPEADLLTADLLQQVDEAVSRLTPPRGQVAQLVLLDGLSIDAAAEVLRLSPDATARALHEVRVHLRGVVAATFA
jgi:DNA-directed RNA polymerase specialized sigma24 family protein